MSKAAWIAVALSRDKWGVAVVQEDVAGYSIDESKLIHTWIETNHAAQAANEASGVSPEEAWRILESSMAASRAAGTRWGPRGT